VNEVWDVVVVGAGPAGSSAALAAVTESRAGATSAGDSTGGPARRVLLLEKATLPRYKTCGGGIIGASASALPPGFVLPLKDEVHTVEFTHRGRRRRTRRADGPLFGLVDRTDLDAALAEAATSAGVVLRTGTAVARVEDDPEHGTVRVTLAGGEELTARAVVGADGSASRVGGYVGVRLRQVDLGLEAEIPVPAELAGYWKGRVLLDWGPLPGSYGWVFPKGDSLTVGVICARGNGDATRRYLQDFLAQLGLAELPPAISSGHLTRCREDGSPLSRGRVLVAGDAAGLLEPWTREGISFALRSGRLAGQFAARLADRPADGGAAADGYRDAVEATLGREMRAGARLLAAFERRPLVFHTAVTRLAPAWAAFTMAVRGETTFADVLRDQRAARYALALIGRPGPPAR
jgi:geranylgeranyl reductase family protein